MCLFLLIKILFLNQINNPKAGQEKAKQALNELVILPALNPDVRATRITHSACAH